MIVLCRLGTMHENYRVKLTASLIAQPDTWSHMSSLERSGFVRVRCGKRVRHGKVMFFYLLPHGLTQTNPRDDGHSEQTFLPLPCPKKRTSLLHRMQKRVCQTSRISKHSVFMTQSVNNTRMMNCICWDSEVSNQQTLCYPIMPLELLAEFLFSSALGAKKAVTCG